MIKYYKLFDLLNRRNMNKSDLLDILSSKTIAKLSKGANMNTDVIDKICLFLKCQPSDIMEVVTQIYELTPLESIGEVKEHKNNIITSKETIMGHDGRDIVKIEERAEFDSHDNENAYVSKIDEYIDIIEPNE